MRERIVVIAEQKAQGQILCEHLQQGGYETVLLSFSPKVHVGLAELAPRMVIYDCDQCASPSTAVFRNIRIAVKAPLLVIGPKHNETFVVHALREGADDCLCKPYSAAELLARVEAHLRRYFQWHNTNQDLKPGELLLDELTHSVIADGREVKLTPTEHRLLRYLLGRNGKVATREELRECIWGTSAGAKPRSLGLHIYSLRKKLEPDPHHPQRILTKRGIGYYLNWKAYEELASSE